MKKVTKFGFGQIAKQTPDFAKWVFRIVLYLAAVVNFVLSTVVEIPEDVRVIVGKYSLYAVTLVHGLSKMFGLDVEPVRKY